MLRTIERPTYATWRSWAYAASSTCCTRCTWEAKQATMIRCCDSRKTWSMTGVIFFSAGVKPGVSALVESVRKRSTPSSPSRANARRSVIRPSSGSWSILKSPVWRTSDVPVRMATASASGIEWLTATNSSSKGPRVSRSPALTFWWIVSLSRCSRSFEPSRARVSLEPTRGMSPRSRRRYGVAPMWSSWPWVSTSASTASRRSRIGSKSGRIRSTPGWWSSGKSTPQSTISRRPSYSKTVMLRPTSPSPPSGMTRRPPAGRGAGALRSGWGWLKVILGLGVSGSDEAGGSQTRAERGDLVVVERDERAAHAAVVQHPEQLEGCLGGGGSVVGDAHHGVERREERRVDAQGLGVIAADPGVDHRRQLVTRGVRDDRDQADAAVGEVAERGDVVAGVDRVAHLDELGGARKQAGGLLDRGDVVVATHCLVGVELDEARRAAGHVVEHDREVGRLGHRGEVVTQADLAGLVVVGADEQHAVDADLLGLAGQLHRVGGGIGADPRDDARAVTDRVLHGAEDLTVLGHRRGGALPGRPADDDPVVAVVDEMRRDPSGPLEVDAAVLVERGGHRGEEAAERDGGTHGRRLTPRSGMTSSAEPGACRRSALRSRHGVRRGAGAAHPRPARRRAGSDVEEDVRRAGLHGRRPHGGRCREPGLADGARRPGRRRGVGRRLVGDAHGDARAADDRVAAGRLRRRRRRRPAAAVGRPWRRLRPHVAAQVSLDLASPGWLTPAQRDTLAATPARPTWSRGGARSCGCSRCAAAERRQSRRQSPSWVPAAVARRTGSTWCSSIGARSSGWSCNGVQRTSAISPDATGSASDSTQNTVECSECPGSLAASERNSPSRVADSISSPTSSWVSRRAASRADSPGSSLPPTSMNRSVPCLRTVSTCPSRTSATAATTMCRSRSTSMSRGSQVRPDSTQPP